MKRRFICLLAVLALILAMQITVFAQNTLDLTQDGQASISIRLGYDAETTACGSLLLIRVGDVQETDGNCAFVPTEAFAPAWAEDADLHDADFAWDLLAYGFEQEFEFEVLEVSEDGTAVFENLKLGLYLIAQDEAAEGYEAINPFLIGVPNLEDGAYAYQVEASPKVSVKPLPTEPKPTKPTEPQPSRPPEPNLPQTGQLNWPVPLMAAAGLLLFAAGWSMWRKGRNES